jgi:3'-phosphoadenosine 5'-phosphosulfate (PAPS) 3'-phosphatase
MLAAIDVGRGTRPRGFWTLDPIDGTKGFLRNQQYAVALGYVESGTPTLGVMGCPNLPMDMSEPLDVPDPDGCLYMAHPRARACTRRRRTTTSDAHPHHPPRPRRGRGDLRLRLGREGPHRPGPRGEILESSATEHGEDVGEPVRLDSQCKYAVVARGQADAYLRLPTRAGYVERIWDHAAGALIAARAGRR